MTATPRPARVNWDADGVPFASDFGDVYHSRSGADLQARAVFLAGNDLPQRWCISPVATLDSAASPSAYQSDQTTHSQNPKSAAGIDRSFTLLETGFGLGNNFLTTLQSWLSIPPTLRRYQRLTYIGLEQFPPNLTDLCRAHGIRPNDAQINPADPQSVAEKNSAPTRDGLAQFLIQQWPPCTPDCHVLQFDEGRFSLHLHLGAAQEIIPRLLASVDAVYLDGFGPKHNPDLWSEHVFAGIARLCTPESTLATWCTAGDVRRGLAQAGFACQRLPGFGAKRQRLQARYQPRYHPPQPKLWQKPNHHSGHALIVGAGLAGASVAHALANKGWRCTVIDEAQHAAAGASGNPAGLMHGVFHAQDGPHSRILRSAALFAAQTLGPLLQTNNQSSPLDGQLDGFLRFSEHTVHDMQARLDALNMDKRYIEALTTSASSAMLGRPVSHTSWHYPQGGWVSPAQLVAYWLDHPRITCLFGKSVARLEQAALKDVQGQVTTENSQPTGLWQAFDVHNQTIGEIADVAILANAGNALHVIQRSFEASDLTNSWWQPTLSQQRGQVSWMDLPPSKQSLGVQGLGLQKPVSSGSYAIEQNFSPADRAPVHRLLFGATHQQDDSDASVRCSDHLENLDQLQQLLDLPEHEMLALRHSQWQGRSGWRVISPDKLPLLGGVPCPQTPTAAVLNRPYWPSHLERCPGLFIYTALGSRGLTLAPLLGEALACWISGHAVPVDRRFLAALDPVRFVARHSHNKAAPTPTDLG